MIWGLIEDNKKNFEKKKSHKAEKGGGSHSARKSRKGALMLCNGFVFHVRCCACIQNEVLSIYGRSA